MTESRALSYLVLELPGGGLRLAALGLALLALVGVAAGPAFAASVERVEVPGSSVLVEIVDDTHFRVSLDGANYSEDLPLHNEVLLRYGIFDPLSDAPPPAVPAVLGARDDSDAYIVQYRTPILEAYMDGLQALGAKTLMPMHYQGQIVRMSPAAKATVEQLPYVRWVGPVHAAYRLEEGLIDRLSAGRGAAELTRYNILLLERGRPAQETVAGRISAMGGQVERINADTYLLEASLNDTQLLEVSHMSDVLFIDPWGPLEDDMDVVRENGGGNYLETIAGYTGQGVRAEAMDGALRTTHVDFQSDSTPLIHGSNSGSASHGTPVYGIVFGDGTGDASARGMMPDADGIFADNSGVLGNGTNRYNHTAELVDAAGPYRAVFQTNSTGSPRTFFYNTTSADIDNMLFDHDFVLLQSQSNAGNQDSRPEAWAKNSLACGGYRHQNTLTRTDDAWSFSASIGPASDGRIKPDLSNFYDSTRTTSSGCDTCYTSFGGTSGATPVTAGHMGLIQQMWADGVFLGTPGLGRDVFDSRSHMTTAKALAINTARQYEFTGTGADMTRVHQGWGTASVRNAYDYANCSGEDFPFIIDESSVIAPFATDTYTVDVEVAPKQTWLRATMVYADPMGNPAAALHRINDLSLRVTSPDGKIYWGNNGLLEGNWSTSGGVANNRDTVENVFIRLAVPGTWTVEVIANEIIQDGHVETPAMDADYALVVSAGASCGINLPWDEPYCSGDSERTVNLSVCNFSDAPQSYELTLEGIDAGVSGHAGCTVDGPTSFADGLGNPIPPALAVGPVDPQSCTLVPIQIDRPASMTSLGDVGCYKATITNTVSGGFGATIGSIQDRRDLCPTTAAPPVTVLATGEGSQIDFTVTNTSGASITFDYRVEDHSRDMDIDNKELSLNSLPVGTAMTGNLTLGAGAQAVISVPIDNLGTNPFEFRHLVLSTNIGGAGFEPLASRGVRTRLELESIYDDGFESGDTAAWSEEVVAP